MEGDWAGVMVTEDGKTLNSLQLNININGPHPLGHYGWHEVACKHTGCLPPSWVLQGKQFWRFAALLNYVRKESSKPVFVNSWYRSPNHPLERRKPLPGPHCTGLAADLRLSGVDAWYCVNDAFLWHGWGSAVSARHSLGIGVSQRAGSPRFVHVDIAGCDEASYCEDGKPVKRTLPRPRVWSY